jgi:NADH-quinone oxidoreductase subunit N
VNFPVNADHYFLMLPILVLFAFTLIILVWDLYTEDKKTLGYVAFIGAVAGLIAVPFAAQKANDMGNPEIFFGMISTDMFSYFMQAVFLIATALVTLLSVDYVGARIKGAFVEFYEVMFSAVLGMMLMASSRDLLMIYVGLELTSISSYILAALLRHDPKSNESGMKYFLNGAVASAVLLFGLSLVYGLSGTTNLVEMAAALGKLDAATLPLALVGVGFLIGGFGFKVSAAPFHFWAPDVYEGAPTPVTAFFSVGPKGAALAAILRLFVIGLGVSVLETRWVLIWTVLSVATMFVGNLTALNQTNLKRMLAYSSVAQAGYILTGVVAAGGEGGSLAVGAVLYYVLGYVLTNLGLFAIVTAVENQTGSSDIDAVRGLGKRNPLYAYIAMFLFVSLIGIPPTVGFFGKFFLLKALLADPFYIWLAVALVLNSAISVGYYYKVVKTMFLEESGAHEAQPLRGGASITTVVLLSALGVLLVGILADPVVGWAVQAGAIR